MTRITKCAVALGLALAAASGIARADGDAAAGEKVFNKCKACHALEPGKNKVGPSLAGVFGRKAGAVDGFSYSEALVASGISWDEENLEKYLSDPKGFIPGNKMAFPGLKKEDERENVIAFLKSAAN